MTALPPRLNWVALMKSESRINRRRLIGIYFDDIQLDTLHMMLLRMNGREKREVRIPCMPRGLSSTSAITRHCNCRLMSLKQGSFWHPHRFGFLTHCAFLLYSLQLWVRIAWNRELRVEIAMQLTNKWTRMVCQARARKWNRTVEISRDVVSRNLKIMLGCWSCDIEVDTTFSHHIVINEWSGKTATES